MWTAWSRATLAARPRTRHLNAMPRQPFSHPATLPCLAWCIGILVLLPGLGDPGVATDLELPVLDRARAALGAPLTGLERSPWLPDQLRTQAWSLFGSALGARLPHALASAGILALTVALARTRGLGMWTATLAGAFAFAFPLRA